MSVLIWVSNSDVQRSNRICSQDQHAQAQHWLRQAQLMHAHSAEAEARTQSRSRQGGLPPLPCSHLDPRPMLSMHELSLPEPMLSLSMLIFGYMSGTCPGRFGTLFGTFGTSLRPRNNVPEHHRHRHTHTHLSIRELIAIVEAQCCTHSTTTHNIA